MRDPLYKKIIEGLNGTLDGNLFEACACDLLRSEIPGLVPVPGGSDRGFDGAIPDLGADKYPLICTVQKDSKANLVKNLEARLADGAKERKAAFATSRPLTPAARHQLDAAAADKGYTLIQIFDQTAIANLLHGNPRWRKELLGIPGDPPALSVVPIGARAFLDLPLVGRDEDLQWLEAQPGDSVLVGQPGSGKTALLHALALKSEGLFANAGDRAAVADDLRAQKPKIVIIDDAHLKPDLLATLRHLRRDIGADYKVIASCWPAERDAVLRALELPATGARTLEQLSRDEVVKVIAACGVQGPDALVNEILNQAEGRPGLAVMLTQIALRGDWREIREADALSREVITAYKRLLGPESIPLLATFAVGGKAGMDVKVVAAALEISHLQVHTLVAGLAAGGVLVQVQEGRFSVNPPALRHGLLKDVFYGSAPTIPIAPLLLQAPSLREAANAVLHARHRGAPVPDPELRGLLQQVDDPELWYGYCYLGESYARWVVENYPQHLVEVASAALTKAPDMAITALLKTDPGQADRPFGSLEEPFKSLGKWIFSSRPGTGVAVRNRRTLIKNVLRYLTNGGKIETAAKALAIALSPKYEATSTRPGSGREVVFSRGVISEKEVKELADEWPAIARALSSTKIENWKPFLDMLGDWASPSRILDHDIKSLHEAMQDFARTMLRDLEPLLDSRPGFLHRLRDLKKSAGVPFEAQSGGEFEIVFPSDRWPLEEAKRRAQSEAAVALADKWSKRPAREIADLIAYYLTEASIASLGIGFLDVIPARIASQVQDPADWLAEFMRAKIFGWHCSAFMRACLEKGVGLELVERCIEDPHTRAAAVSSVITIAKPPETLFEKAMARVDETVDVATMALRNEIPEKTILALLSHGDPAVAGAVAVFTWMADPKGSIPASLTERWREAIVKCPDKIHGIDEILRSNRAIAKDWLKNHIDVKEFFISAHDHVAQSAFSVLSQTDRIELLEGFPPNAFAGDAIRLLVGHDMDVFEALLKTDRLKSLHLEPLERSLSDTWIAMAKAALKKGYSVKEIAHAPLYQSRSWSGSEAEMLAGQKAKYEPLLRHEDREIREIGTVLVDYFTKARSEAAAREKREAIYGI